MRLHVILAALLLPTAWPSAAGAQNAPATPAPATPVPAATPPATPGAPGPMAMVKLRYKFVPGSVWRYRLISDAAGEMSSGGKGTSPIRQHSELNVRMTIRDVRPTDGAATIVSQIEDVHSTTNGQEVPVSADVRAQMKTGTILVMTPGGKILSTQANTAPAALPGAGPALPGTGTVQTASGTTVLLPDGPVKIGDTWNTTGAFQMLGMQIPMTSSLQSLTAAAGGTIATIHQTVSGLFQGTLNQKPLPVKLTAKMSAATLLQFDVGTGTLAGSRGTIHLIMTLVPRKPANAAAGMVNPSHYDVTTRQSMTRLEDDPAPAPTMPGAAP